MYSVGIIPTHRSKKERQTPEEVVSLLLRQATRRRAPEKATSPSMNANIRSSTLYVVFSLSGSDVLDSLRYSLNRTTPEQKKGQEAHWPPTPFPTIEPFSYHPKLVGRNADVAQDSQSQPQSQGCQSRQGNQNPRKDEDQATRRGQGRR